MSSGTQKGRRSRVQGGWAQSNQPRSDKSHGAKPTAQSEKSVDAKLHHVPPWIGKGIDSDMPAITVKFQQPREEELKVDDTTTQMITSPGVYDLSDGEYGISRVKLFHNFLEPEYAYDLYQELYDKVPWEQKSDVKNGVRYLQPRMVAWYAHQSYSYSGVEHPARPQWLPGLNVVRKQLEDNTGLQFNSVLCNLYRDCKDQVSWHSDDEELFGRLPCIASISLGDTRMFELRRKVLPNVAGELEYKEYIKIPLPAGSLLLMEGATQLDWQHRIPSEYHDREPRINLTYRNVVI